MYSDHSYCKAKAVCKRTALSVACVRGHSQSVFRVQFVRELCMPGELAGCCSVTMETSPLGLDFIPWHLSPELCCCPLTYSGRPSVPSFILHALIPIVARPCCHLSGMSHTSKMWLMTLTWKPTRKSCNVSVLDLFYFKYSKRVGSYFMCFLVSS